MQPEVGLIIAALVGLVRARLLNALDVVQNGGKLKTPVVARCMDAGYTHAKS